MTKIHIPQRSIPLARAPDTAKITHRLCNFFPPQFEATQSSGITHRLCKLSPPMRGNLKQWNCTSPVQFLPPCEETQSSGIHISCVISLPASARAPPTRVRSRCGVTQTYRFRSHVFAPPQMPVGAPLVGALAPPDRHAGKIAKVVLSIAGRGVLGAVRIRGHSD